MDAVYDFVTISALIGEPARAKMLWNLLDGRAYTASELALEADISSTSASNHLTKLLKADLLKVESQGRHRYYSFSRPEIAYVIESLASLSTQDVKKVKPVKMETSGIKYCRSCYDHLAGYAGVRITEALETKGMIKKAGKEYSVAGKGWKLFGNFNIYESELISNRRPLTKQCLDWTERRPHLAGQLGALLLSKMLEKNWFRKVQFSRELIITTKGKKGLYDLLAIGI